MHGTHVRRSTHNGLANKARTDQQALLEHSSGPYQTVAKHHSHALTIYMCQSSCTLNGVWRNAYASMWAPHAYGLHCLHIYGRIGKNSVSITDSVLPLLQCYHYYNQLSHAPFVISRHPSHTSISTGSLHNNNAIMGTTTQTVQENP